MVYWAVPILVIFPTLWDLHNFIEVIPIEAMEPVKEPSSQESQPPAAPEAALPSTMTSCGLNLDTLHYDPEQGSYQKLDLTKKRPFKDIQ